MSIRSLVVENFQSIKRAEIEFGQFTVFLGQNSCGKTASLRALRTMATNDRKAASYISFWASSLKVTAITDTAEVVYKRTATSSSYTIKLNGQTNEYTKLQGAVPEEVSKALGIWPEDCELLLRDQHQGPYLLRESGSEVARIFGALTNADVLLAASREANRLKSNTSTTLKVRESDFDKYSSQLEQGDIRQLTKSRGQLSDVESRLNDLKSQRLKIQNLCDIVDQIQSLEGKIETFTLFELPSSGKLESTQSKLLDFKNLLLKITQAKSEVENKSSEYLSANNDLEMCGVFIQRSLDEWGMCPVCERSIDG